MDARQPATFFYKRSRFVTQLPVDYRYSPSHAWIAQHPQGVWRVGLTKFATRMLGEVVDHGFETAAGAPVKPGQVVGWIEGFKAISDIYCVGEGEFAGCNPALRSRVTLISEDPYDQGWLYEFRGEPDSQCMDVQGYCAILDDTIDRILQNQKGSDEG